jgi:hypothetical protein
MIGIAQYRYRKCGIDCSCSMLVNGIKESGEMAFGECRPTIVHKRRIHQLEVEISEYTDQESSPREQI